MADPNSPVETIEAGILKMWEALQLASRVIDRELKLDANPPTYRGRQLYQPGEILDRAMYTSAGMGTLVLEMVIEPLVDCWWVNTVSATKAIYRVKMAI